MPKPFANLPSRRRCRLRSGFGWAIWTVAWVLVANGQSQTPPQAAESDALLVAFVYNFCLFTEWPPLPPGTEHPDFVLAVVGKPLPALAALGKRRVGGRRVRIVQLDATESLPTACNALFCNGLSAEALATILKQSASFPILTLSSDAGFCAGGGIVEFFVRDERMRFRVSLANLNQAKLHISSQLLKLAELVPAEAGGN